MVLNLELEAWVCRSVRIVLAGAESCRRANSSRIISSCRWTLDIDTGMEARGERRCPDLIPDLIEIEGWRLDFLEILGRLRLDNGIFVMERGDTISQLAKLKHIGTGATIQFLLNLSLRCLQVLGAP